MNILIYEANSGFTSYTKPLASALSAAPEVSVSLMTSKDNKELDGMSPNVKVLEVLRNYKANLKHGSIGWLMDRILVSWRNIRLRNRMVAKADYDVVLVEFTLPILDQFLFGRLKKKARVLYTVHDVIPPNKSRFWSMKSLKKLYDQADHLIVHSEENMQELMEKFRIAESKISVVHHGVKADKCVLEQAACKQKLGLTEDEKVVLFYGGIRPQKGLDHLICALDGVACTLVIAGALPHGDSFEKYDCLIEAHHVKTIKMIEYVSDEMTDVLYGAADIVALPYKYFFSQSGVFMQEIQYRKLIVASDVSSFGSHICKYRLGNTCKPDDVPSLAEAIKSTLASLEEGYAAALFDTALSENSWESSADKHLTIMVRKNNEKSHGE